MTLKQVFLRWIIKWATYTSVGVSMILVGVPTFFLMILFRVMADAHDLANKVYDAFKEK